MPAADPDPRIAWRQAKRSGQLAAGLGIMLLAGSFVLAAMDDEARSFLTPTVLLHWFGVGLIMAGLYRWNWASTRGQMFEV